MAKTRYRYRSVHDEYGIKDLFAVMAGLALIAVLCVVIYVIYMIVTYWYVSVPVALIALYLWYTTRINTATQPKQPDTVTRETREEIKTSAGLKTIHTTEVFR